MIRSSYHPVQSSLFCRHGRKWSYFILPIMALLLLFPAAAPAMDVVEIARKLQKTYEEATNVVADFSQTTTMKFSSRVRRGGGTMIFSKPGRMRWDYLTPDYQVLTSDGETISMYFEKNGQMIVSSAKDYLQSDVTYAFFSGTGDILRDFAVSTPDVDDKEENSLVIKLTPNSSHPHVSSIHVWVDDAAFLITHLRIVDHFDTVTDLFFNSIQIDSDRYNGRPINEELFVFKPPADTEIIEQF